MDKTARLKRNLLTVLFIVVVLLPGCAPEDKRLDFDTILPSQWSPYATYRLDTNADGERDWVILYTYDPKEKSAFTPVDGVIYHADRGEPPIVFPYPLDAPGWAYLGEGKSSIELKDVLKGTAGPEIVYQSVDSDGITTRVALFYWQDHAESKLIPPLANEEIGQWYHCLGKFEGQAGVKLEAEKVTVWERTNERSQLAIRKTYLPQQGNYMVNKERVEPSQVCLDFAYGQPQNVDTSPYPEKVLMAFYRNFATEEAYPFLTKSAQNKLRNRTGQWAKIAPWPRTSVTGVCIKELNYNPAQEVQVQADMVVQAEQTRDALATAETIATNCACAQPECSCPPTPTAEVTSAPVWVTARVEYQIQNQSQQQRIQWGLVKVKNAWRIDQVVVE